MSGQMKKRYGLPTAICMVVGIVIGSGVFFKAEKVLTETGGNLPMGILAWIIGGIVMVCCAFAFSILATRYEKVNGIIDYAEAVVGKKYAYFMGWFLATLYYPTLVSVLAWVSARYICVLIGWEITGPQCMILAGFLLIASFVLNTISPVLSGKFQVSTTVIKLIPLGLMAVFGTIKGLSSGMLMENFTTVVNSEIPTSSGLFKAIVATCFAYEGWIIATSINSELKNAKKNLPKALVIGTLIIVAVYIIYYIGLAGTVSNADMMANGEQGARLAFSAIFSDFAGTLLFVFVVISCLGTLNGLMLGCSRGIYSIAVRDMGPNPKMFRQVDEATNMPVNSSVIGLLIAAAWLVFFYGSQLDKPAWFGMFSYDSSELPIVTIYAMYLPVFIFMLFKEKGLGFIKGKLAPVLGLIASVFMVIAAVFSHGVFPYLEAKQQGEFNCPILFYLITYAVIMLIGAIYMNSSKRRKSK